MARTRAFHAPWASGVNLRRLPWRNRTRTCLERADLLDDPDVFGRVTIGELAKLKGMGALSIVDAIAVGEPFLDRVSWTSEAGSSVKPIASEAVGSPTAELSQQETEDLLSLLDESWASQVSEADPRFADVMPATGYGTIFERIDRVVTAGGRGSSVSATRALLAALPQIKRRLQELDAASLGDSLRHYLELLCEGHPNRARAMAMRLGWGGEKPSTLEEAGAALGVTRERVRQIETPIRAKLQLRPIFMPALDRALDFLLEHAPITLSEARQALWRAGLTERGWDPRSILAAAGHCRGDTELVVRNIGGQEFLVASQQIEGDQIRALLRIARKQAGASGASHVDEVLAEAEHTELTLDIKLARRILRGNFQFLVDDWFWTPDLKPERNRLRNVLRAT